MTETLKDVFDSISTAAGGKLKTESVVQWFKAAGIIDNAKIKESDVKKAFDFKLVDNYFFQKGLKKLSEITKVPVDEMTQKILASKTVSLDQVKAHAEKTLNVAAAGGTESKVGKILHKVEHEMEAAAENIAHAAEAGISNIKHAIKK